MELIFLILFNSSLLTGYLGKWLKRGLVDLNDVVRAQMMLNDQEGQKTLSLQKSSKKAMTSY